MKNLWKRLLGCCVVFSMLIVSVNAMTISSNESPNLEEMKFVLCQRGLSSNFLDSLFEFEIVKLYNETQDRLLEVYDKSYENLATPLSNISDRDLKLTPRFVVSSFESGYIDRVYVFLDYEWAADMPAVRLTDAISINWDASEFLFSSTKSDFLLMQYYSDSEGWHITNSSRDTPVSKSQGIGFEVPLTRHYSNPIGARISFVLFPKDNNYKGNGTIAKKLRANVYVEYEHCVIPFFSSAKFTISGEHVELEVDSPTYTKNINDFFEFYRP